MRRKHQTASVLVDDVTRLRKPTRASTLQRPTISHPTRRRPKKFLILLRSSFLDLFLPRRISNSLQSLRNSLFSGRKKTRCFILLVCSLVLSATSMAFVISRDLQINDSDVSQPGDGGAASKKQRVLNGKTHVGSTFGGYGKRIFNKEFEPFKSMDGNKELVDQWFKATSAFFARIAGQPKGHIPGVRTKSSDGEPKKIQKPVDVYLFYHDEQGIPWNKATGSGGAQTIFTSTEVCCSSGPLCVCSKRLWKTKQC